MIYGCGTGIGLKTIANVLGTIFKENLSGYHWEDVNGMTDINKKLELTERELQVLIINLEGLVMVSGMMNRVVIGNEALADALNEDDLLLVKIWKKAKKLA